MKKSDVKVGTTYTAKVSDKLVAVRIDSVHSRGGWNATNTATGRRVHIKSAQRLRGPARAGAAKAKPASGEPTLEMKQPAKAAAAPTPKKDAATKSKRVSALDASAIVLEKAGRPMRAKDLITAMADQGLWTSPGGKTPHATLYAAMMREIATKGEGARFRRVERGLFESTV